MANQWFRLYAEFAFDAKVQMMTETNQRRLIMLLCLRCNGDVTLHDAEIAFQLRISDDEWKASKAEFIARGFIDSRNKILNWEKRQYVSDSSAERVRRHREAKKTDDVTKCNVTVTPPEQNRTDTDTERTPLTPQGEPELPEWIDRTAWDGYLKHRGKKFTKNAQRLAIGKLERWMAQGHDPTEILNNSVMNGWKGLFEPKGEKNGKSNSGRPRDTAEDAMQNVLRRHGIAQDQPDCPPCPPVLCDSGHVRKDGKAAGNPDGGHDRGFAALPRPVYRECVQNMAQDQPENTHTG